MRVATIRPVLAALVGVALLAGCVAAPDLAPLETSVKDRQARIPASLAQTGFGRAVAASVAAAKANRENLAAAREQFGIGRRSLIELLDAEREALASERQRILAAHDRAVLGYATLALTGDLLDAFGIVLPDAAAVVAADQADG